MMRPMALLAGLIWMIPADAAIFNVGPGGTHATVQAAIDAALAAPGSDEIRIANGTYFENLKFQNGNANPAAELLITQYGDSVVRISDCEISNNVAESDRSESGGLRVSVNEDRAIVHCQLGRPNGNPVRQCDCQEQYQGCVRQHQR